MKEIATTILRILGQAGVVALFAFATVSPVSAGNISKTFEFGLGTAQPRSHVRTFPIPCGTEGGVAAAVTFKRLGPDGANNNIPIIIELREPDTATDQEGPIVETKSVTAKKAEQTVILGSQGSNRGCTLPWRVRVKYANEGTAPFRTFGSIRLDFNDTVRNIAVGSFLILRKGESEVKNLGDVLGLKQGRVEITADWVHFIQNCCIGPSPIKLKFQLVDPNGTPVKTVEAYSSNELRSELPKLKLIYQVTKCTPGQWKLKITNLDPNDDASLSRPKVNFTPGCPN